MPIHSFRDKRMALIMQRQVPKGFSTELAQAIRRKLVMLNGAAQLSDLRIPSGNRLEALRGDRAGIYSIRINNQFRLCFRWGEDGPYDVECIDYH